MKIKVGLRNVKKKIQNQKAAFSPLGFSKIVSKNPLNIYKDVEVKSNQNFTCKSCNISHIYRRLAGYHRQK